MIDIAAVAGFDWDAGNWPKCGKHGVSRDEIEDIFSQEAMIGPDPYPVEFERRYNAVGRCLEGRTIFVVFTLRGPSDAPLIRPISARYMHRKEIERYVKGTKT